MSRARDLADGTFSGAFSADSPTLVVDATNDSVGIGTTSPTFTAGYGGVHINKDYAELHMTNSGSGTTNTDGFKIQQNSANNTYLWNYENAFIALGTNNAERARIDSSGNLLVGTTSTTLTGNAGFTYQGGITTTSNNGSLSAIMNRNTNDGDIVQFRKDNSTVGSIGTQGGEPYIGLGDVAVKFHPGLDAIMPWSIDANNWRDNAISLGRPTAYRFDDAYITNGVTTGSDGNEKQDIAELDEAEKRVALAAKSLVRKYRWIDAVEKKGDDARIHVGVIAQDLKAAFEAEGLDAHRYGMFMSNTYWVADEILPAVEEVLDEAGNVVTEAQPERTVQRVYEGDQEVPEGATEHVRLGVRYPELLAFIIGAM